MKQDLRLLFAVLAIAFACAAPVKAQVAQGGNYTLDQSVIASGGGTSSGTNATNSFSIDGTIGQAVAVGALSGSSFDVASGFWIVTPSAPYASLGDGALCSSDLIQLRRYLNGADVSQAAGGPGSQTGSCSAVQATTPQTEQSKDFEAEVETDKAQTPEVARELRVESPPATSAAQTVTVNIRVDTLGDESAYSFRLNYNQSVLTNPIINDGTTGAAIVDCDASVTNRIGCTVEAFPTNNPTSNSTSIREIGAGDNRLLLSITFTVATGAQAQSVPLTLSNVSTSNDRAQNLTITPTNGAVTITGPTAATVSIGGRVKDTNGVAGISGVTITLLNAASGEVQTTATGEDGAYRFDNLTVGEVYIITPQTAGYSFTPSSKVVSLIEEAADIDFMASSRKSKRRRF